MTTRTIPTMFNPFDGAIYVTGTACGFVFGLITGNAPLTAAIASATIVGFCSIIAKLLELYIKGRHDKRSTNQAARIAELEDQIHNLRSFSICTRSARHSGPCNGLPGKDCLIYEA